ncbi:MAG: DUF2839 family protein [Xenococcaceae cyanobacterium MO_167.B27]|nr:DUF2839 family protein [Xenococcaceae cyanobacterium MO_167.B27]
MVEAKRRQESLRDKYGKQYLLLPQWRICNSLKQKLVEYTIEGLIITVLSLASLWLMFRFFPVS